MKKTIPRDEDSPHGPERGVRMSCKVSSMPSDHCCTIIESINDGVCTIDLQKTITYFNPAAETITGFSAGEALGQKCFDIFRTEICEESCPLDESVVTGHAMLHSKVYIISKSGAEKPVSMNTYPLRDWGGQIAGGVRIFRDLSDIERLKRNLTGGFTLDDIVGNSPKMKEILSFLPDIAESGSPVFIEGPTGSGKELIARAVHHLSPRRGGPFIAVNCAALPETLLESELFGYEKGAFTGAIRNKPGRISLADRGTLFLDEISSTTKAFQADLLRVLEDGEFTPLGGSKRVKSDFRIITATNENLRKLVKEGEFREDLYYRLNVIRISLPPLRDRKEDIPSLVEHFIQRYNLIKEKSIRGMRDRALGLLMEYPFPGNIRELENIIEYAFVYCKGSLIDVEHLPDEVLEASGESSDITTMFPPYKQGIGQDNEEAEEISSVLKKYRWNRQKAASALGISRSTLWRKIKKYGLMDMK